MFCAQCGIPIVPGGRFCTGCGAAIGAAAGQGGGIAPVVTVSITQPVFSQPSVVAHLDGGRFARLVAVGIDTIIAIPVLLACYAAYGIAALSDMFLVLEATFLGLCGVVLVQGLFLAFRAQTVGKMLLGLRIMNVATGRRAGFARLVFLRMLVTSLLSALAGIGWIFGLVDALFIFREDRRCLHDFIAGTRVVRATRDN